MILLFVFFFFKQKTAYEMRISDWSSDVCSSDLNNYYPHDRLPPVIYSLRIFTIYPRQEAECPRNWVRLKLPRYGSLAALSTHPAIPLQDQFTLVKELAHRQSHLRFALYPLDVEILGVLVRPVIGVHRLAKRLRGRLPVAFKIAIAVAARQIGRAHV